MSVTLRFLGEPEEYVITWPDCPAAVTGEVSGGVGALSEAFCAPLCPPVMPTLHAFRHATLIEDSDADGLADPGDTLRIRLTLWNTSRVAMESVQYEELLAPHCSLIGESLSTSAGVAHFITRSGLDSVGLMIDRLAPEASVLATFDVQIDPELDPAIGAIVGQGQVSAKGLPTVLTDDPTTPKLYDETTVPVGSLASSCPRALLLTKEAWVMDSPTQGQSRIAGKTIEYRLTLKNTSEEQLNDVTLVDQLDWSLELQTQSVIACGEVSWSIERPSTIKVLYGNIAPGEEATLTYRVTLLPGINGFCGTRALCYAEGHSVGLSDDPDTELPGDATVVLSPYRCESAGEDVWMDWLEYTLSAPVGLFPVSVEEDEGSRLRWVLFGADFYGDLSSHPAIRPHTWPSLALVGTLRMPWELSGRGTISLRIDDRGSTGEDPAPGLLVLSTLNRPVARSLPNADSSSLLGLSCPRGGCPICPGGLLPLLADIGQAGLWQVQRLSDISISATLHTEVSPQDAQPGR